MTQKIDLKVQIRLILFLCLVGTTLLLSSCSAYEKARNKVIGNEKNSTTKVNQCICEEPEFIQPDKIAYYFQDASPGLEKFLSYGDSFECIFQSLEDARISNKLIELQNTGKNVRVAFGRASSFENCDSVCIPRSGQKYNELQANALDLHVIDTSMRYCVTDHGVFFWSGNFGPDGVSEAHIFFSPALAEIYKGKFAELIK